MKRDKRDDVFSKLIRERAGWCCERCEKFYPEGYRQGLHCSHLYSRRHRGTRWHPDNAFSHCYACHQYLGGNPVEYHLWARERMGDGLLELVRERHHTITKYTKKDLEELHKHLKAEHKGMLAKRADGVMGRIDFEAWD
tara:strand:+ start:91 stop:507 length:417 start_codon:yes stop_codon:yes gene_type:complete